MNNVRSLQISTDLLKQMYIHCEEGFPSEAVGILGGNREFNQVLKVVPLINEKANTTNRYKVNGLVVYKSSKLLEAEGYDVLGYYHSHPNHPSQYSEYDRDHALPNLSYTIVSVISGTAVELQSWRLSEDRSVMVEEPIQLIQST